MCGSFEEKVIFFKNCRPIVGMSSSVLLIANWIPILLEQCLLDSSACGMSFLAFLQSLPFPSRLD